MTKKKCNSLVVGPRNVTERNASRRKGRAERKLADRSRAGAAALELRQAGPLFAVAINSDESSLVRKLSRRREASAAPALPGFPLQNISVSWHDSHRGVELIIEQTAWYLTYVHVVAATVSPPSWKGKIVRAYIG